MGIIYPPIMETYVPTFIFNNERENECKISFSLSSYNVVGDIKVADAAKKEHYLQIKMVELKTNRSVINNSSGVYTTTFKETDIEKGKHFFTLNFEDFSNVVEDTFYKIQVRFIDKDANFTYEESMQQAWLNNNQQYLSSWSKPSLLRGIREPILTLAPFNTLSEQQTYEIQNQTLEITGSLNFGGSSEYLKMYQLDLIDGLSQEVLSSSGQVFPGTSVQNQINYTFKYLLENRMVPYLVRFVYKTNNDYEKVYVFKCLCKPKTSFSWVNTHYLDFTSEISEGCISVNVTLGDFNFGGADNGTFKVYIKRASHRTKFTKWETVHTYTFTSFQRTFTYKWKDLTVESGVLYKYAFQIEKMPTPASPQRELSPVYTKKDYWQSFYENELTNIEEAIAEEKKNLTPTSSIKQYEKLLLDKKKCEEKLRNLERPEIILLEDMFLVSNYLQLRIAYNPVISNFSKKTVESVVETLGSKYPFVLRHGAVNYKTFTIGGYISAESNDVEVDYTWDTSKHLTPNAPEEGFFGQTKNYFVDKETLYNGYSWIYNDFNFEHRITPSSDHIYEREFRERVLNFLTDDQVKLFRSTPEGNILVKLTNVQLTPETRLGRRIYSFTATAYEIDECSVDNYDYYKVQPFAVDMNGQESNFYFFYADAFVGTPSEISQGRDKVYAAYVKDTYTDAQGNIIGKVSIGNNGEYSLLVNSMTETSTK